MFANSLYFIENSNVMDGSISSEIKLNPEHSIFKGHFPNAPVTPGVVQMQIVKEILQLHLGQKLSMKLLRTSKFLEVLDPNQSASVHFSINYKWTDFLEVVASGEINGKVFFKMQASYL